MADLIKISDSVDTESSIIAASSTAVKAVYDLAASKLSSITAGTGITVSGNKISNSGVTSFNGSTGAVTYSAPVTSVNGSTGDVTIDIAGGMSNQQVFTASGTFTAPKTGAYTFIMVGGGNGGKTPATGTHTNNEINTGGTGGKYRIVTLHLTASTSVTVTVGAGGRAGANGGNSSIKIGSYTYNSSTGIAGGTGGAGGQYNSGKGSAGTAGSNGGTGGAGGSNSGNWPGGGGGGGGTYIPGVTNPTASAGGNGNSNGGKGGYGFGAGGGAGGSATAVGGGGTGGTGAKGVVVVYW